jgi:hypothetical protein
VILDGISVDLSRSLQVKKSKRFLKKATEETFFEVQIGAPQPIKLNRYNLKNQHKNTQYTPYNHEEV